MAKKEKEKSVVKIDDKEYDMNNFSNEQKMMVNHIVDLERKLQSSEFNLVQLRFGRQAFTDALKASLSESEEGKEEK
jgi:hypothetical protein|tara:strand:- start:1169 stop:1399 length:231 start_codon:yes stop_codon:yes gene_type:complete